MYCMSGFFFDGNKFTVHTAASLKGSTSVLLLSLQGPNACLFRFPS